LDVVKDSNISIEVVSTTKGGIHSHVGGKYQQQLGEVDESSYDAIVIVGRTGSKEYCSTMLN